MYIEELVELWEATQRHVTKRPTGEGMHVNRITMPIRGCGKPEMPRGQERPIAKMLLKG